MQTFNIHDAKTQFSRLVDAAANGEEIIIARAGKPAARLVALADAKPPRRLGLLEGKIRISDDFDAPLPDELLSAFEGR
jgi:prevent-host-death family protein